MLDEFVSEFGRAEFPEVSVNNLIRAAVFIGRTQKSRYTLFGIGNPFGTCKKYQVAAVMIFDDVVCKFTYCFGLRYRYRLKAEFCSSEVHTGNGGSPDQLGESFTDGCLYKILRDEQYTIKLGTFKQEVDTFLAGHYFVLDMEFHSVCCGRQDYDIAVRSRGGLIYPVEEFDLQIIGY